MLKTQEKRIKRHKRVRMKVIGTNKVPRLCVFRSSKHIYVQLIDDHKGKTLLNANESELKKLPKGKQNVAKEIGKLIAKKALEGKISKVVFDRGGYKYQGRVRALAEGAREGGLKF